MIVPEKLWYIKQLRNIRNYETNEFEIGIIDLAYVTYFDENKEFENRKKTGIKWSNNSENEQHIIKNELLSGYKIQKEISRWSTSNVVWRVIDPRGFEFEIYSGNMMELLEHTTITNREIMSKCILGFDNGKVILLPENSQPYKDALLETNILKNPDKLIIGNIYYSIKDKIKILYLGQFYTIKKEGIYLDRNNKPCSTYNYHSIVYKHKISSKPYHFFKIIETPHFSCFKINDIVFQAKPKVTFVENGTIDFEPLDYIMEHNIKGMGETSSYGIVSVTDKKINENEILRRDTISYRKL